MAREYFCAYHSFLKSLTPYGDAEVGRLFRACLQYSMTGEDPGLCGNERFIWPTLKQGIDRDKSAYEARCAQNRVNGSRGGRPSNQGNRTVSEETERNRTVSEETEKTQEEGEGEGKYIEEVEEDARARDSICDPALAKVMDFYMDHINPQPSPLALTEIQTFLEDLDANVLVHAMQIAVDENKRTWSYIKAILRRYRNSGLRTLQLVTASEQAHEAQKGRQQPRGASQPARSSVDLLAQMVEEGL